MGNPGVSPTTPTPMMALSTVIVGVDMTEEVDRRYLHAMAVATVTCQVVTLVVAAMEEVRFHYVYISSGTSLYISHDCILMLLTL